MMIIILICIVLLLYLLLNMFGFFSQFSNSIIKFFTNKKQDLQIKRLQQIDFKHNLILITYKQAEYLVLTSSCGNSLLLNKSPQAKSGENKSSKKSV